MHIIIIDIISFKFCYFKRYSTKFRFEKKKILKKIIFVVCNCTAQILKIQQKLVKQLKKQKKLNTIL